jgi:peptidyl-prolyl cis-trans isomerase SurA
LTDQKVWTKAVKDSTGMAAYYEGHKDKFMWAERAEVTIYTAATPALAKAARKLVNEGKDKQSISAELNKESQLNVQIEEGIFSKEDKDVLAKVAWAKGLSADFDHNGQTVFVDFKTILAPTPKKLSECRGLVTSEYQNYLEQEWISELRAKHKFEVNKSVLYTIK